MEKTEIAAFVGLGDFVAARNPRRIAVNFKQELGPYPTTTRVHDGLSHTDYLLLTEELGRFAALLRRYFGIAAEIGGMDADLVLLGMKATDNDQQQVGPMVATLLGRPCVTAVASFDEQHGKATSAKGEAWLASACSK